MSRDQVLAGRATADVDLAAWLASTGRGRATVQLQPRQFFFSQDNPADCVFYIQTGRAKVTVVSKSGKEATIMFVGPGDFVGEESLIAEGAIRVASAAAIVRCTALKIQRLEMLRTIRDEAGFSEMFLNCLLARRLRIQADLIDQRFNFTERRLARTLLLMADCEEPAECEPLIQAITQETLAEMIGTSRSRVNFFMNRFRKLGFIEYKGRIRVHKTLLNAVLIAN